MKSILQHKFKLFLGITIFLALGFIHFYLPRILIEPNNSLVRLINPPPVIQNINSLNLSYRPLTILTKENFQLKGYKIYAKKNKGTIIFLHGIRAFKEHFLPKCKTLANLGYNSVIIDLRGHGESQGKYCTFGYHERDDIVSLIDHLQSDTHLNKNIGVWGQSLGAAIALQTMEIDQRIKYGIVESTFSDFSVVSKAYLKRLLKIEAQWFVDYMSSRINSIGNFNNKKVKPMESAKNIKQPILIVHGTKDDRIDIGHSFVNFKNLQSKQKTFYQVKGANHVNVWKKGGIDYHNRALSFIKSNSEN